MLFNAALALPGMSLSNVTAFQLLIAGGLLLAVAALLLALSRVRRVSGCRFSRKRRPKRRATSRIQFSAAESFGLQLLPFVGRASRMPPRSIVP